jgi:23S rRNA pseudouridine2605 synthase
MSAIPLLKALTRAGIGSRRKVADKIRQGKVEVNGEVVVDFRYPLDTETDRVSIDNRHVDIRPKQTVYLLLNKPAGVLSTTFDSRGGRTVIDILPGKYRRLGLYPVGRLDKNTTGLLLLTNDGMLTHQFTHPRFEHEKEYLVSIKTRLEPHEKRKLEQGIKLDDGITHNAIVKEIQAGPFNYSITIHEGRKRQVRRMFEYLGHRVIALKRIRMGNLLLGDLGDGKVRVLNTREAQKLLMKNTSTVKSASPR